MAERQEKAHVVSRGRLYNVPGKPTQFGAFEPVKVFDDRADARRYASLKNKTTKKFRYRVTSVKKG